ncbi:MAG TPA: ROK family protein [Candidatus Limnocylindria bacterium]|nr:ROK family protein [Candidatus Limnocylindria bacterium]
MTESQLNGRSRSRVVHGPPALGIDVGGTGVKAAVVDTNSGELLSNRIRLKTPVPATPQAVAQTTREIVDRLAAEGPLPADLPVGCGLPGVVKEGRVLTVANIDQGWLAVSAEEVLGDALGRRVIAINDADAAGIAEMRLGAGRDRPGTVILLTIGTGIGSAVFRDGVLLPNTEFGHLEMDGYAAETEWSGVARDRRGLKWKEWAAGFNGYLARVESYLWPDLLILSGGVSKSLVKFEAYLETRAPVVPAHFLNTAGIVGAALWATGVGSLTGQQVRDVLSPS